jgi:DNA helicase-2/ATP-dependent DNA helicase PcrA
MNILKTLNHNQQAAAYWDTGPLLVLAGPGSGKTATLTARVARLITDSEGDSFRILCLTFTRKAAAEMRERLLRLVPQGFERVLLTTFHSFATDILRQHGSHFGLTPDFDIIDDSERVRIVKSILAGRESEFSRILSAEKALLALDYFFQNVIRDESIPELLQDEEVGRQLQTLFRQYKEQLRELNSLDYGAILYLCEELLRTRPRLTKQLRTVYRYICVDEFQDTNIAQYQLLRSLAPDRNSNLFIVGDDDQVIYQWNGASPARIKELAEHYDIHTIQLPENYRCPPSVVELANLLIQHNGERATDKKPLLPMKEQSHSPSVRAIEFDAQEEEAKWIAGDIGMRLESGCKPRDITVLARSTKLLERVCLALANLSIPAHVQQRKSQFESAPLRFIMASLKLAAVRTDADLASAATKALSDCIQEDIVVDELFGIAGQVNGDHLGAMGLLVNTNSDIPKDLRKAVEELVLGKYEAFVRTAFSYFDFIESTGTEGQEQFADYMSERRVWQKILDEIGGEDVAYALSLGQFLQELALANKTPDAPAEAIRCLTIHSSKGMEFPHVYLVGLAEDQLPSFQSKKAGESSREMQEERRNCFVAITRAIESLTLTYARKYNGWNKQPSRFLHEMGMQPERYT